jgi:hypothetical protein
MVPMLVHIDCNFAINAKQTVGLIFFKHWETFRRSTIMMSILTIYFISEMNVRVYNVRRNNRDAKTPFSGT